MTNVHVQSLSDAFRKAEDWREEEKEHLTQIRTQIHLLVSNPQPSGNPALQIPEMTYYGSPCSSLAELCHQNHTYDSASLDYTQYRYVHAHTHTIQTHTPPHTQTIKTHTLIHKTDTYTHTHKHTRTDQAKVKGEILHQPQRRRTSLSAYLRYDQYDQFT